MTTSTKTHSADTSKHAEDFAQSPHVARAIREGRLTKCNIITSRIDNSNPTCVHCTKLLLSVNTEVLPNY